MNWRFLLQVLVVLVVVTGLALASQAEFIPPM